MKRGACSFIQAFRTHAVGVGVALLWAGPIAAQRPPWLSALAIPPAMVGTCLSAPDDSSAAARGLRGRQLFLTSDAADARRDIAVFIDEQATIREYTDRSVWNGAPGVIHSERISAIVMNTGEVRGTRIRERVTMDVPAPGVRVDSAVLRLMREGATIKESEEAVSTSDQGFVLAVAAWLVRRCTY